MLLPRAMAAIAGQIESWSLAVEKGRSRHPQPLPPTPMAGRRFADRTAARIQQPMALRSARLMRRNLPLGRSGFCHGDTNVRVPRSQILRKGFREVR